MGTGWGDALLSLSKSVPGVATAFDDEKKRREEEARRIKALTDLARWKKDMAEVDDYNNTNASMEQIDIPPIVPTDAPGASSPLPPDFYSNYQSNKTRLGNLAKKSRLESAVDYGVVEGGAFDPGVKAVVDAMNKTEANSGKKAGQAFNRVGARRDFQTPENVAQTKNFLNENKDRLGLDDSYVAELMRQADIGYAYDVNDMVRNLLQKEMNIAPKVREAESLIPVAVKKEEELASPRAKTAGAVEGARGNAEADTPAFVSARKSEWDRTLNGYNEAYQQFSLGKKAPDSATGDVAAINALEKVREINSAVMFGDFQKWQQAGSLWADVIQSGAWDATNKRLIQGRIPPEKMKDIQNLLNGLFDNRVEFIKTARNRAAETAKQDFGWDDERINRTYTLPDLGITKGEQTPDNKLGTAGLKVGQKKYSKKLGRELTYIGNDQWE